MAAIPFAYQDDDLLTPLDSADPLAIGAILGSSGDGYFLVGDPEEDTVLEATSDAGIDPIQVSISDSAPGSGVEGSHIKLALSEAGLASAIAGDPLSLGSSILGGVANAVKVWVRWVNSTGGAPSGEISLGLVAISKRAA